MHMELNCLKDKKKLVKKINDKSPLTLPLSSNQLSGLHQLMQKGYKKKAMRTKTRADIKKYIVSIGKGLQVDKSRQRRSVPIYVRKKLPIPFRGGDNMYYPYMPPPPIYGSWADYGQTKKRSWV